MDAGSLKFSPAPREGPNRVKLKHVMWIAWGCRPGIVAFIPETVISFKGCSLAIQRVGGAFCGRRQVNRLCHHTEITTVSVGRRRERLPVGPWPENIRSVDPDVQFTIVASAGDGMHILGRGNCCCLQLSYGTVIGIVAVDKILAEFSPRGLSRTREGEKCPGRTAIHRNA